MASGDGQIFHSFLNRLMAGDLNMGNGGSVFKCALLAGYSANPAHTTFAQVQPNEVVGSGYTAGGVTLANVNFVVSGGGSEASFTADDPVWLALDVGTPSHAVIYADGGTSSTRYLMMMWELSVASSGGSYSVLWDSLSGFRKIFELSEV